MYLKKVKIFGFKSFADEIDLEFDSGLTAVVGPNGCGKSNVLDAIRWVIGEQSAGRLRGSEMSDMIFKGSKNRKALGFASVELTLDNSRDILPVEYRVVTVSRKLYRSGESEYYINKNLCRLKDIKELFMDTGIGTSSYSVMEQNNITSIIESSPFERRRIIEEAAGIRKYREKKLEAERSLERTRSDLNEVKNIMAEVQKNIRRLQRQTGKAKRFREGRRRLRYLEVSRLCQEYVKTEKELNAYKANADTIKETLSGLTSSKALTDASILKLEKKRTKIEDALLKENHTAYSFESEIRVISDRIKNYDSEQQRLLNEIERAEVNFKFNQKALEKLNNEISMMEETGDSEKKTQSEVLASEADALFKSREKLNIDISGIKKEINEAHKMLFSLRREDIEEKKSAEASRARLLRMKERRKDLDTASSKSENELRMKKKAQDKIEERVAEVGAQLESVSEYIESIDNNILMTEKKRSDTAALYHSKKSEFEAAKKYLPQLISLEKLSEEKVSGISGPISAVMEKELSSVLFERLARASGERLGWMIAKDKQSATKAISVLRAKELPPLTFIILNLLPDLKEDIFGVSKALDESLSRVASFLLKEVSAEGELIISDDCVLTGGGDTPKKVGRILSLESEIEALKSKLSSFEDSLQKIRKEKSDNIKRNAELSSEIGALKDEQGRVRGEVGRIYGHLQFILEEVKGLEQEILKFGSYDKDAEKLKRIELDIKSQEKILSELNDTVAGYESEYNKLNENIAEVRGRRSMLEQEIKVRRDQVENFLGRITEMNSDNKRLTLLIKDLKEKNNLNIKQHKQDISKVASLKKKEGVIAGNINRLDEEKRSVLKDITQQREKFRKIEYELNKLKDTYAEKMQAEERLKERISSIKERLIQDMDIELEDALKDYSYNPVDPQEILSLKNEIERIGEVNLTAPEEYDRESERFNFIKKQLEDLETADTDIRNIIRKINKQTRERFQVTFDTISENFRRIFRQLFEGGDAYLYLEDPENVLESGIQIKARPEGKSAISLLSISGGESALTAIALMFAVYEVKRTPFCVLDEVDSPLDDTNLRRFLGMLRNYTDTTQFVIVTHNKQTMQMCDTFYGITMEEYGVSKMISVKLQNASKRE